MSTQKAKKFLEHLISPIRYSVGRTIGQKKWISKKVVTAKRIIPNKVKEIAIIAFFSAFLEEIAFIGDYLLCVTSFIIQWEVKQSGKDVLRLSHLLLW